MKTAGYSGTPLAKKLGIKEGMTVRLVNSPPHYYGLFSDMPPVVLTDNPAAEKDFIHYFETKLSALEKNLPALKKELRPDGALWVSWYKKSAKIPTDITEDAIRKVALDNGLVDVKVCAVDELWSGLKLVIPLKDRRKGN